MRKLNVRVFVRLVVGVVVLTAAIVGLHTLQTGRIARALLRQAERNEEQGERNQVVKFLSRYLELEPDDNEERAHLGRVLASDTEANYRKRERALFVLEEVLRREPDREAMRRLLVPVAMDLKRFELAGEHLEVLRKNAPDDGAIEYMLGGLKKAREEYTQAAEWYRRAFAHDPSQIEAYVDLADVLRRHLSAEKASGKAAVKEANEVIDRLVVNNASSARAHLARWRFRRDWGERQDRLEENAEDVRQALKLAPLEAETLLAAAEWRQAQNQPDQARDYLKTALKEHAKDVRVYRTLAGLEIRTGHRQEAVACLREGINALSGTVQHDLMWTAANVLLDNGEIDEANSILEQMRKAHAIRASIEYLQARVLMHRKQWSEAAQILERTRPLLESSVEIAKQADVYLGACYEQLGEPAQQRTVYERVLARDPASANARLGLASAYWALGRIDDAQAQYEQLMKLPNAPAVGWAQIARLGLLRNLQSETKDWAQVEQALAQAEKGGANVVETTLLRAEMLVARHEIEKAQTLVSQACEAHPKQILFWTTLAALAERQGQHEEASRLLKEAETRGGDSAELRLAWARFWGNRRGSDAQAKLKKLAENLDRFTSDDQSQLFRGLAEENHRVGGVAEAERLWNLLAAQPRHANDLRIRLLLFELSAQANDATGMTRSIAEFERIEKGKGTYWHYAEAIRLIRAATSGNLATLVEAREHLDKVASQRPSWPAVMIAKAELEVVKGNPEAAIASYRRAIDLGERNPGVVRQLVQLLYQGHRYAEADQEIRKLRKEVLASADLNRLAVAISLRNQDTARAVQMAMDTVSSNSKDYKDHLWLGQVMAAGDPRSAEAEQHLRQAVELGGNVPGTWVALVQFLVGADKRQDAEGLIPQARKALPPAEAPLVLAQCLQILGQVEEASKQFDALLQSRGDEIDVLRNAIGFYLRTGNFAKAEPILKHVSDAVVKASSEDLSWARRQLALALTFKQDYRRFPEALALLGLHLDATGEVIEDHADNHQEPNIEELRTRARVLAMANNRKLRTKAIALLQELNKRHTLEAEDRFLLARLFEADGNSTRFREEMQGLLTVQDNNPQFLAHFIWSSLRERQFDDAERGIAQLEKIEKTSQTPGRFGIIEMKAKLEEARGDGARAIALLEAYVAEQGAPPERMLLLAHAKARQKQTDAALDICEKAWKTCAPERVAGVCVAVLRASSASPAQCMRVEPWFERASAKNPSSIGLILVRADLCDLCGRYDEAEACYRKVIERDSNNHLALNNLAWLLALRTEKGDEALPLIERAIAMAGPKAELLDTRAAVFMILRRGEQALADIEEATRDTPTASRYFHLARIHLLTKNSKAAIAALQEAKKAGLAPEQLHPVERPAYQKMLVELDQR